MLRNNRGQIFTIIEILVVVAILVILGKVLLSGYLGAGGSGKPGGAASPKERAQGVDCMNNLRQIRYAIDMDVQADEAPPASLADLASSGISGRITQCPVSGQPYSYDPGQGRVWCTTPGHEGY